MGRASYVAWCAVLFILHVELRAVLGEEPHDLIGASLGGAVQRRLAVVVVGVDIHSVIEADFNGFDRRGLGNRECCRDKLPARAPPAAAIMTAVVWSFCVSSGSAPASSSIFMTAMSLALVARMKAVVPSPIDWSPPS